MSVNIVINPKTLNVLVGIFVAVLAIDLYIRNKKKEEAKLDKTG